MLRIPVISRLCAMYCRNIVSDAPKGGVKFSDSSAFYGNRDTRQILPSKFAPDYYSTEKFKNRRLLSWFASIGVLLFYLAVLREESDIDAILDSSPVELTTGIERKVLQEELKRARKIGKDTRYIEAELGYLDVKHEALKAKYDKT